MDFALLGEFLHFPQGTPMDSGSDGRIGEAMPPLRLGFIGFVVAGIGVAIGFVGDSRDSTVLFGVASAMVAVGIAIGFVAIAWGWIRMLRGPRQGRQ